MTTLPEEAVTLWAVNIHGPDDLIAAPDYLSAVRMANAFNAWWMNLKTKQPHNDAIDARMWAIPTDWPGNDAQGHAVELSKPHPEYQWLRDTLSALEPSAARELALDVEFATIRAMIYCYEGDSAQAFEAQKALAKIDAAIRTLSSPDHADAGKVEGDGCPCVKGVIQTKFGESICFSGIDDARLILVSVCGNSGLVPVKYLLPHQLYMHDVQKLSEQGEVLVCAVPIYDQQINVTSALPSDPTSEGAE
ncbi:hypothetical protein [Brucella intermedia]|uniref:hypothetical protein n=1 Tax=Brucella intermedia TaxID=94625 RepID=UPI00244ED7F7|nr:hypothetical protein [Brucella intermedia]WGJ07469.1 hypothetical protein QBQ48_04210 [Brucella intermedia]